MTPPADWAQDVTVKCKCADCRELAQFLRDPREQVHRFKVRKDRRRHLHGQIDQHGCDVDHVTDRGTHPQTLVCTKNRKSYEEKSRQFAVDEELLTELTEMAKSAGPRG